MGSFLSCVKIALNFIMMVNFVNSVNKYMVHNKLMVYNGFNVRLKIVAVGY